MYSIYADETCIYNDVTPLQSHKVINPKLTMEDSAAGSLEFTLPPGNVGYDIINMMTTDIIVYCEQTEIWRGRVLNESVDFYKRKKMYCEGELAFLNDTIQPPKQYLSDTTTIRSFLESLIEVHNANVGENRRFTVGIVDVTDGDAQDDDDAIYRYTNYESTLKCVNEKLVDRLGGHLRIRHQNGVRFIDYLKDDSDLLNISSAQQIMFGKNLLDYTQNFTMDELATVIVPRGSRLDESPIEGLEAYLTVESVNDGSIYVESTDAVNTYGRIIAVVDWENVTNANTLLEKAHKYLEKEQFDKMSLEISALDLHYLNRNIKQLELLEKVRCISKPHGMDKTFTVTKMVINLDQPDSSTYTLGTDTKKTLTQITDKANSELAATVDKMSDDSTLMRQAKEQVFAILQGNAGGYVSFVKNNDDQITEIKITDQLKDENSLNMWRWNNAGLIHFSRENYEDEWVAKHINAAITMDGGMCADYINSGHINCDLLNGGTILGQNIVGGKIESGSPNNGKTVIQSGSVIIYNTDDAFLQIIDANNYRRYITFGANKWTVAREDEGYYKEFDPRKLADLV